MASKLISEIITKSVVGKNYRQVNNELLGVFSKRIQPECLRPELYRGFDYILNVKPAYKMRQSDIYNNNKPYTTVTTVDTTEFVPSCDKYTIDKEEAEIINKNKEIIRSPYASASVLTIAHDLMSMKKMIRMILESEDVRISTNVFAESRMFSTTDQYIVNYTWLVVQDRFTAKPSKIKVDIISLFQYHFWNPPYLHYVNDKKIVFKNRGL